LLKLVSLIIIKFIIYNLTNDQCRTMIRFGREDINILSNALQLPEKIICNNRTVACGLQIGRTVPSMNPQQFSSGELRSETASA
jgi:hypothetical protein